MGIRGTLLWPLTRLAGWADDNPLSAVGIIVALGGISALVASVGVSIDPKRRGLAYDGVTFAAISETILAQPAYIVVAIVGLAVFVFYDG